MTPERKTRLENAIQRKRIKTEHGKWYVLCNDCTGRKKQNVYHPVRKKKIRTIEESCLDALLLGVFTCKSKTRERL